MRVFSTLALTLAVGSQIALASNSDLNGRDAVTESVTVAGRDSADFQVVPIEKRSVLTTNGVANLDNMQNALYIAGQKYTTGARRFFNRTGRKLPGYDQLIKPAEAWCAKMARVRVARRKHIAQSSALSSLHSKRQSVKLTNREDGLLWSGNLAIGWPKQFFNVNFDTGSSDFWVADSSVDNGHATYVTTRSRFVKQTPNNFQVMYGDGSYVSGPVYSDRVYVGNLQAQPQYFSAADGVSEEMTDDPSDGIVGLGWPAISNIQKPTLAAQLFAQGAIKANQFSFKLGRTTDGALYLGGQDKTAFTGAMSYTPVTSKGYWMVRGTSYVNNTPVNTNMNMIVDTGTTLVIMPPAMATALFSKVMRAKPFPGADGYWQYPCAAKFTVSLSFAGSSTQFQIPSEFFNLGTTEEGSSWCVAGIVGQNMGINAVILGDVFLRSVYSTFDYGGSRVGFAKLSNP